MAPRRMRLGTVLLLGLSACGVGSPTGLEVGQDIVFHMDYENFAWGHRRGGWYVDRDGNVWSTPAPVSWGPEVDRVFGGASGYDSYAAPALEAEYRAARDSLIGRLDPAEVREMVSLIRGASRGRYSEPESTSRDGGGTVWGALLYDGGSDSYRKIVLSVRGDWTVVNESDAARTLEAWLEEVSVRIAGGS